MRNAAAITLAARMSRRLGLGLVDVRVDDSEVNSEVNVPVEVEV